MKNIPIIIPNYNQVVYLLNQINWWLWYNPGAYVYVIDNGSQLHDDFYSRVEQLYGGMVIVERLPENNCVGNLRKVLDSHPTLSESEYYVISDPDIMPLPDTPPNFLEIFKHAIDNLGYHHAGFGLRTDDIPDWLEGRANMLHDEMSLLTNPVSINFEGRNYRGFKAPIDTTFALYKKSNGGWSNPQSAQAWSNSLRLFHAYHLPWYLHPEHLNDEMKNYFSTAKFREPGVTSTGVNNYRPKAYRND